jgi:hypothetical protein
MQQAHGTDLETGLLDALYDAPGVPRRDRIGLDDGQRQFHIQRIITEREKAAQPRGGAVEEKRSERQDASPTQHEGSDADVHLGAVEGDRPGDRQHGNPHGSGVDAEGLPDDPIATCEDAIGANVDESEGG